VIVIVKTSDFNQRAKPIFCSDSDVHLFYFQTISADIDSIKIAPHLLFVDLFNISVN
jgi:hypothetical protein